MPLRWEYLGDTDLEILTESDKALFSHLPLFMRLTGVRYLCKESAEEFARRCNAHRLWETALTPEKLQPFFGLRTNVASLTSYDWAVNRMGVRGKPGPDFDQLQPKNLKERILHALERAGGPEVWDSDCYADFRQELERIIVAYNRGISQMPYCKDGCSLDWVEKIEKLAYCDENEQRYEELFG